MNKYYESTKKIFENSKGSLADDNRKIVTNFTDSFEYADKSKVIVELEEI